MRLVSMHIVMLPLRNKLSSSHIYSRTELVTLAREHCSRTWQGKKNVLLLAPGSHKDLKSKG